LKATFQGHRLQLVCEVFGDADDPVILFAHGGGQTRHAWKNAAAELAAAGYRCVVLDLRGHGESDWAADGDYTLGAFGADLASVADQIIGNGQRAPHIVGASLGGLGAIVAAGQIRPSAFRSLTLVDITPNMDPGGVAKIVGFMGEHAHEGFSSVEEAADVVSRYLPHRPRPAQIEGLQKNLRRHPDGRWRWHWDPAFISGVMKRSAISSVSDLEAAVRALEIPIHLIRGRMSELVTEESVSQFRSIAPDATYTDIAGARHMVAGDRNDVFTGAVRRFLDQIEGK